MMSGMRVGAPITTQTPKFRGLWGPKGDLGKDQYACESSPLFSTSKSMKKESRSANLVKERTLGQNVPCC